MKKAILLFLMVGCGMAALSQRLDTSGQRMSDRDLGLFYLKKSRTNKTVGWAMLGVGTIAYAVGISSMDIFSENGDPGTVAAVLGSLAMVGSIPFFISGAKNKGRAEILLRYQNLPTGMRQQRPLPVIGLSISVSP